MKTSTPCTAPWSTCRGCAFLGDSDLRSLDAPGVDELDSAHTKRTYPVGSRIFHAGAPVASVYVLTRGLVAIRRTASDGESMIVRLLFPVCTFDLAAFLRAGRHSSEAFVLAEADVCELGRATFDRLLERYPAVGEAMLRRLSCELACVEENMLALGRLPVRKRLLRLLLQLSDGNGRADAPPGSSFTLPLSRQDMASVLGIRPETLTRTIQEVGAAGLARFSQRTVDIPCVESLLAAIDE